MFYFTKRRKIQQMTNQAMVMWIEDLDDMIMRLDDAITELSKDLQDLTDFVEENLD
jgi:hypothetical protein